MAMLVRELPTARFAALDLPMLAIVACAHTPTMGAGVSWWRTIRYPAVATWSKLSACRVRLLVRCPELRPRRRQCVGYDHRRDRMIGV